MRPQDSRTSLAHAHPATSLLVYCAPQSELSGSRLSSDQGSQYTSRAFQRYLESHEIAKSVSRPGNPWDNALVESFSKTLKRELVNGKGYKTREKAKQDVFK